MKYTIVLLRHGESEWNRSNLFTGWTDVSLSAKGIEEATSAGRLLKQEGYGFDIAYTSVLRRAIDTLNIALGELELSWIPVVKHWRLNERHYGSLQGLNKAQMAEKAGAAQVKIWRRSYDVPPPPLEGDDERHPGHDPRYAIVPPAELPATECLKDTVERFLPYWGCRDSPAYYQRRSRTNRCPWQFATCSSQVSGCHRRRRNNRPEYPDWCSVGVPAG